MAIRLQESLRGLFYAPFYVALAQDAYAQEGVAVTFVSSPRPGDAAINIMTGAADVCWGGPMRVMQTYQHMPDCDLVCFSEVVTRDPFLLVGRTPNPDFILADLAGLTLGSVSEVPTPWMCLQEDLRQAGIPPESVRRVATATMAENCAALAEGSIDVVQVFEPFASQLVAAQNAHVWYAAAHRGATSYTTFYARRAVLAERREEVRRMVRAIWRTLDWVHQATPEALATTVRPYFNEIPMPILISSCERYQSLGIWGHDPILPRAGYERLRVSLVSGGFVNPGTTFEVAVDNSIVSEVRDAGRR